MTAKPNRRRCIFRSLLRWAAGFVLCAGVAAGASRAAEPDAFEQLASRSLPGLRADVASLIVQGASGGVIDMAVAANLERPAGIDGGRQLSLVVEVAGQTLLSAARTDAIEETLGVEFYAYVVDAEGLVSAHLARQVEIQVDDWGERISTGGLRFVEQLAVPDGELSVRSLILVRGSGRFGLAVSKVGQDDLDKPAGLGRPRYEDSCSDWVSVVPVGSTVRTHFAALPVWTPGELVSVVLTPEQAIERDQLLLGVLESSQGGISSIQTSIEPSASTLGPESTLSFQVPEVDSGIYSFWVTRSGEPELVSEAVEVWIVPAIDAESGFARSICSWPEVMQEARRAPSVAPIAVADKGRGSRHQKAAGAYVALLKSFGEGQELATAGPALVDWEAATVGSDVRRNLATLLAVQVETAQSLAAVDPESLLPLFALHEVAYREHFKRRQFGLAGHSRRMASIISEIWLDGRNRDSEPSWAADALVGLAQTADLHLMYAASQGFLERAVEVDPTNRAGRLLLAMLYEKLGEYEPAAHHLEQLVSKSPADAEGWLRLAILQRHLDREKACRDSLRKVIGQRPVPWILSLAYQTLVKDLYAHGDFGEGLKALEEAEVVLPAEPALALARAYGLDRLGRGSEALRILEQLPHGADEGTASRLHYAEAGAELTRRVRDRIRRNVMIRQPRLAAALVRAFEVDG